MKKIIFYSLLLLSVIANAQQDTVKLFNSSGVNVGFVVTPTPAVKHDTVIVKITVPCDTAKTADVFFYTLYVGSEFATIYTDAVKGLELKKYLKDYGYNRVSYYGFHLIPKTDWPKLRAFNKDLRLNYGIKSIEVTGDTSASFTGTRSEFNKLCTDTLEKFDRFNMEREYWNADPNKDGVHSDAEVAAAWNVDSVQMTLSSTAATAAGCDFVWYEGWPIKTRSPLHTLNKTRESWFHVYRTAPDSTYGSYRWINANAAQKLIDPSKKRGVTIGVSAESAFMRGWLTTHKISELRTYYEGVINKYSNLKLVNIQVFMYSEIKISQPPKTTPAAAVAARLAFPVTTPLATPSHLDTAVERK